MKEAIPVVLAGFGNWAQNRTVAPLLEEDSLTMNIVAVTSISGGAKEYETAVGPFFKSKGWKVPPYAETIPQAIKMLQKQHRPAAIILNTPNRFHFSQAKQALEAGLNVYIERPIVCHDDNLELLVHLARERGKLIHTGVQRRLETTYRYLYESVASRSRFGRLTSIRCTLAVGERLQGWRRVPNLAGGGIVLDSGYHLLDAAAWIASAAGCDVPDRLTGAVLFRTDTLSFDKIPLEVETTAVGYVHLPQDILLIFDFSYNAPYGSLYECLEISDDSGTRITLIRNQSARSSEPALITHQQSDGQLITATTCGDFEVPLHNVCLSGKANNTLPLKRFLTHIRNNDAGCDDNDPCDAMSSMNTWRLIRGIYMLAITNK